MDIALIEQRLCVASVPTGVAAYDFDFGLHFACTHPYRIDAPLPCVSRTGAIADYAAHCAALAEIGLQLVNSPEEHRRAAALDAWYPLLEDLTPRSRVFDTLPAAGEIEAQFGWPVFIKGTRQTSRHAPELSIARNRAQYESIAARYAQDAILHWQRPVVREFVELEPVAGAVAGKLRPSMEFRSFWWRGECVGWGRYWQQLAPYACADVPRGLALAAEAARRLAVPFVVIDIARTLRGTWTVIECNDAQESGYAAITPGCLWREVLDRLPAGA